MWYCFCRDEKMKPIIFLIFFCFPAFCQEIYKIDCNNLEKSKGKVSFFKSMMETNEIELSAVRCGESFAVHKYESTKGLRYTLQRGEMEGKGLTIEEVLYLIDQHPNICNVETLFAYKIMSRKTLGCLVINNRVTVYSIDLFRNKFSSRGDVTHQLCFLNK